MNLLSPTAPSRTASESSAASSVAVGSGEPVCGDGGSADEAFDEGEVVAAEFGYGAQDVGGFTGDFGADAVAGEDCNFQAHIS